MSSETAVSFTGGHFSQAVFAVLRPQITEMLEEVKQYCLSTEQITFHLMHSKTAMNIKILGGWINEDSANQK